MIRYLFILLPNLIFAKLNIKKTKYPARLEAVNKSHVFVDYSKSFSIANFSEVETVTIFQNNRGLNSKASRKFSVIERKGNTILQPLKENKKIIAKLDVCKTYQKDVKTGPYVRLMGLTNKLYKSAEVRIEHDPLQLVVEDYKSKVCLTITDDDVTMVEREEMSKVVTICDTSANITSVAVDGRDYSVVNMEVTIRGADPKNVSLRLSHCKEPERTDKSREERSNFWIHVGLGLSLVSLVMISSLVATLRVCRGRKGRTAVQVDNNFLYGAAEYEGYEGSNTRDTNSYYQ